MSNKELVSILTTILDMLERSEIAEAKLLLDNKMKTLLGKSKTRVKIGSCPVPRDDIQWDKVKNRLRDADSLEEGFRVLNEEGVVRRKRNLEYLARQYKVPVRKSERMDDLARRILDSAVGSRIYADTIKSLDVGFRRGMREKPAERLDEV